MDRYLSIPTPILVLLERKLKRDEEIIIILLEVLHLQSSTDDNTMDEYLSAVKEWNDFGAALFKKLGVN